MMAHFGMGEKGHRPSSPVRRGPIPALADRAEDKDSSKNNCRIWLVLLANLPHYM